MMEKITAQHPDSQSLNVVNENIEKLKALFPTIVKEGKLDVEELKALLGDYVETNEEYYRFTWAGKAMARQEANKPSTATLRPNKAESKDWDTTENIFIEGDNLEVLKLLQKSYANQIKMIYIDPPYNTGKDFVYKDNYADNLGNYLALTGQTDEEGKKLSTNSETDGRYHSNWLNMIYPRLKLARNLLKEDGVIFISIDDNEIQNLRKVCDEVFGEENFIECITWNKRIPKNDKGIGNIHEYILMYVKDSKVPHEFLMKKDGLVEIDELLQKLKSDGIPLQEAEKEIKKLYKRKGYDRGITLYNSLSDDYRLWGKINMSWPNSDTYGPRYDIIHPATKKAVKVPDRGWRWKEETFDLASKRINGEYSDIKMLPDGSYVCGRIWFAKDEKTQTSSINFLDEADRFLLRSILSTKSNGGIEVEKIFDGKSYFSYPKPLDLLDTLIDSVQFKSKEIVLDFFAGSGTTSHAVMRLNSEDKIDRKWISVQLDEPTRHKNDKGIWKESEAFKGGYKTISDVTKERIRRSGELIKQTKKEDLFATNDYVLDIGFKAFKLDSSNINAWDGSVENFEQNLFNSADNIKAERTEDDVLYEILLKNGLNLTLPIATKIIADKTVYSVGAGALFICLADGTTTNVAEGIGKWKEELAPVTCKVIFKDNGFSDVDKTNSIQILKRYGITEVNSI